MAENDVWTARPPCNNTPLRPSPNRYSTNGRAVHTFCLLEVFGVQKHAIAIYHVDRYLRALGVLRHASGIIFMSTQPDIKYAIAPRISGLMGFEGLLAFLAIRCHIGSILLQTKAAPTSPISYATYVGQRGHAQRALAIPIHRGSVHAWLLCNGANLGSSMPASSKFRF